MRASALCLLLAACGADPKTAPAGADGAADGADGGAADGASDGADGATDGGADGADGGADGGDTGEPAPDPFLGPPPAIVLFIGDGMGPEHVRGASLLRTGADGGAFLDSAPVQGRLRTASLSGYTDSAAAATTLASGRKTWNTRVGLDGDGAEVETLLDRARLRGMVTGVVTTDALTGATPASFLVHADSRYDDAAIAAALIAELPEVLLGGGALDLLPLVDPTAVQLVRTPDELAAAAPDGRPLLGLFADDTLPFAAEATADAPTLAALVDAAMARLEAHPDGFFLVVEGARIDHASHANQTGFVHHETAALDDAVAVAAARLAALEGRATHLLVTADHECGGMRLSGELDPEGLPRTTWRWFDHTNATVPVFAWSAAAGPLDGAELDHLYVHAALEAAVHGRELRPPTVPRLADGQLDDLGPPVVAQTLPTDFGEGYNQLDQLRVTADARGLWIGVDGVFDDFANGVLLWLDLDLGAGTGVGADLVLNDYDADLDRLLSTWRLSPASAGLGFDAAVGQLSGTDVRQGSLYTAGGLRLFQPPRGEPEDLYWDSGVVVNYDMTKMAAGSPAAGAGETGRTEGGMEVFVSHEALWGEAGPPSEGATIGVFVALGERWGTRMSNQALPPWDDPRAPSVTEVGVPAVVALDLDADGVALGAARIWP
jgi:alkaline phosphatase